MQETESTVHGQKFEFDKFGIADKFSNLGELEDYINTELPEWEKRLDDNAQSLTCSLSPADCKELRYLMECVKASHFTFVRAYKDLVRGYEALLLHSKAKSKAPSKPKKKRSTKR